LVALSIDAECLTGVNLLSLILETEFAKKYEQVLQVIQWVKKAEESGDATLRLAYASAMSRYYTIVSSYVVFFSHFVHMPNITYKLIMQFHLNPSIIRLDIETKAEVLKQVCATFIRMSNDEDKAVKAVVGEFWANNLTNWLKSPHLLLELLEKLAESPRSVAVSLELLINRCSMSPDFRKLLFDKPLSDLPYQVGFRFEIRTTLCQCL